MASLTISNVAAEPSDRIAEEGFDAVEAIATEKVGEVIAIPANEVHVRDRLRPVDENWALRLGEIMLAEGQRTPIEVCRLPGDSHYTLVSGAHRHAAHLLYPELPPIKAIEVTSNALDRRSAEVSENLWRKDLAPIERATFIAELIAVMKMKRGLDPDQDGRTVSAQERWQDAVEEDVDDANATIALAYGWTDEVAEQVGLSRRTIYNDLLLYRRLSPGDINALRQVDHPCLGNASQLKALAGLEEDERRHVIGLLIHANGKHSGAPFSRVGDAIAATRNKSKPSAEDKRYNIIIGTLGRMSLREKQALFASPNFHKQLPPSIAARLSDLAANGDQEEMQTEDGE